MERAENATLRELIVGQGRRDVLARLLGYQVKWHHMEMINHLRNHDTAAVFAWRGSGKSIISIRVDIIGEILENADITCAIASRAYGNAKAELVAVKEHFERDDALRAVFGDYVGDKWSERDGLFVKQRRDVNKNPTLVAISPESAVSSKHVRRFYGDDLVDQKNSQTPAQREKILTFYWKTCDPIIEPDGSKRRFAGTRYHHNDLYGSLGVPDAPGEYDPDKEGLLLANERSLIIPAIHTDEDGNEFSVWPEKFTLEALKEKRTGNAIHFSSQFQQTTKMMRSAGVIEYDWINRFSLGELPEDLPTYCGFDLCVGKDSTSDEFWALCAKLDKANQRIYFYKSVHGRFILPLQQKLVIEIMEAENAIAGRMDGTAFQEGQFQQIKAERPLLPLLPYTTNMSKRVRIEQRQGILANGQIWIVNGLDDVVEQMVSFTGAKGRKDDAVDAFDLCLRAMEIRKKLPRAEPGLF